MVVERAGVKSSRLSLGGGGDFRWRRVGLFEDLWALTALTVELEVAAAATGLGDERERLDIKRNGEQCSWSKAEDHDAL